MLVLLVVLLVLASTGPGVLVSGVLEANIRLVLVGAAWWSSSSYTTTSKFSLVRLVHETRRDDTR